METNPPQRNLEERVGALEQDMKVVSFRLHQWDRRHENSPERLTKLEQQFENQADKLDDLEAGIAKINSSVQKMGTKLQIGIGAMVTIGFLFDKFWPLVMKGLGV